MILRFLTRTNQQILVLREAFNSAGVHRALAAKNPNYFFLVLFCELFLPTLRCHNECVTNFLRTKHLKIMLLYYFCCWCAIQGFYSHLYKYIGISFVIHCVSWVPDKFLLIVRIRNFGYALFQHLEGCRFVLDMLTIKSLVWQN